MRLALLCDYLRKAGVREVPFVRREVIRTTGSVLFSRNWVIFFICASVFGSVCFGSASGPT
jgi:hypothetical protein